MDFQAYDISVVPLIMFLTKLAYDLGVPKKFCPLVSLILGIIIGIAYFAPNNILKGIIIGIFLAASSVGFYSGTKNVYQGYKIRIKKKNKSKARNDNTT
ncbi:hypothetical protein TR13x_00730 [Caloranaerobacter sp. TR13]|uniref:hypothetical protein n=1 Tax=Caloranaerobacter sp. TR13 TaxID=1302151 RepID=UPI0006D3C03B|nr:hypothetical protein [Caloranaerobacter sp. TR13]KPU27910.1 hypothetical protein TR13x_00730 [Caloranaerobacter sp. TR13]